MEGDIDLLISAGAVLRVEVTDGGSEVPPVIVAGAADDDGGRGLSIVAGLACRWGAAAGPRSRIWFELDLVGPGWAQA